MERCLREGHDFFRTVRPMNGTLTAACRRCLAAGEWSEFGFVVYREPQR